MQSTHVSAVFVPTGIGNTYVGRNRFVAFAPSSGVHTTDEVMTRTYVYVYSYVRVSPQHCTKDCGFHVAIPREQSTEEHTLGSKMAPTHSVKTLESQNFLSTSEMKKFT
jgi:uncharacterized protein (DUF2126 family)